MALVKRGKTLNLASTTLGSGAPGQDGADGASAYEVALANGFVGTESEWLASLEGASGQDGASGSDGREIEVQLNGTVLETRYAGDPSWSSLGDVQGPIGPQGIQGTTGSSGMNGANGRNPEFQKTGDSLEWRLVGDPSWITLGNIKGDTGTAGLDGSQGVNGLGWTGASYNPLTGIVTFTSSDGLGFTTSDIRGSDGAQGTPGTNGSSAYQVAVSQGFIGTEQQWLDSLIGADGAQGVQGPAGNDGYTPIDGVDYNNGSYTFVWAEENEALNTTTNNGFQFSFGNGATSSNGFTVPVDCVAKKLTFASNSETTGEVELYVNKAATGATVVFTSTTSATANIDISITAGDTITFKTVSGSGGSQIVVGVGLLIGSVPVVGADGDSAYEVWLNQGNVGTEADFITAITGPQGVQGLAGNDGVDGADGLGVPAGGGAGQVLVKASGTDNDTAWADSPPSANGIPIGGTSGQILVKNSSTDYDVSWTNNTQTKSYGSFYLTTGGATALAATATTLVLNQTRKNTGEFTLLTNEITYTGITKEFEISACTYLNNSSTSRSEYGVWIEINSIEIPGSRFPNYQRGYDSGANSSLIPIPITLNNGDVIRIRCQRTDGAAATGYQDDNGTNISIKEI